MKQKQTHSTNFLFEWFHIVIYYRDLKAALANNLFVWIQLYIRWFILFAHLMKEKQEKIDLGIIKMW